MREEILERIRAGHQGITKCQARASLSVWWPGSYKEIKEKVESCHFCQESRAAQKKEPLMPTVLPNKPWQKVSTDLFELAGRKYLVVMDYYLRFIEILNLVEMKPGRHPKAEVCVCTTGYSRGTSEWQWHRV